LCVTSAVDGSIKVWRAQTAAPSAAAIAAAPVGAAPASPPMSWTCAYSFRHKDCPAQHVAFSNDGTLLAVAQRNVVTLWDPIRCVTFILYLPFILPMPKIPFILLCLLHSLILVGP
jgi:hypothetical protein